MFVMCWRPTSMYCGFASCCYSWIVKTWWKCQMETKTGPYFKCFNWLTLLKRLVTVCYSEQQRRVVGDRNLRHKRMPKSKSEIVKHCVYLSGSSRYLETGALQDLTFPSLTNRFHFSAGFCILTYSSLGEENSEPGSFEWRNVSQGTF